jgi:hypothetical protein
MDASLSFSSSADSKFSFKKIIGKVLPIVKKVLPIAQVLIPGSGIIGKAAGVAALL